MRPETLKNIRLPDFSVRIMAFSLAEEGFDPTQAFRAAGLPPELLSLPQQKVTGQQELDFQRSFVAISGYRPDLWIRTGLRYRLASFGSVALVLLTAPTLRHLLKFSLLSHFTYSLSTAQPIEKEDKLIGLTLVLDAVPEELHDFIIYRDFAATTVLFRELWGDRFPLTSVALGVRNPKMNIDRLLGYKISMEARQTCWSWPGSLSDKHLLHGSAYLYDLYSRQLREKINSVHDLVTVLNEAIGEDLGVHVSLGWAAGILGLSERTLERRLSERGLSFRALIGEVRKRRATLMLTTTRAPISEIAWKLGYADLASFNHAFQRWTGESPKSYRAGARRSAQRQPPRQKELQ